MTAAHSSRAGLMEFGSFCLHAQDPVEARQLAAAADALRRLRRLAGLTRCQVAAHLGVPNEIVVAIENGYGAWETVGPLVDRAMRLDPRAA